jgi:arylsulfatase A
MNRCAAFALAAALFGLTWPQALHAAEAGNSPSSPQPNVILILADDLGVNDLGCYGRAEHRTPHLDRLASQGMRFTCAYTAQPICSP